MPVGLAVSKKPPYALPDAEEFRPSTPRPVGAADSPKTPEGKPLTADAVPHTPRPPGAVVVPRTPATIPIVAFEMPAMAVVFALTAVSPPLLLGRMVGFHRGHRRGHRRHGAVPGLARRGPLAVRLTGGADDAKRRDRLTRRDRYKVLADLDTEFNEARPREVRARVGKVGDEHAAVDRSTREFERLPDVPPARGRVIEREPQSRHARVRRAVQEQLTLVRERRRLRRRGRDNRTHQPRLPLGRPCQPRNGEQSRNGNRARNRTDDSIPAHMNSWVVNR